MRFRSKFRRYSTSLPIYLQNRPKDFILYCLKKNVNSSGVGFLWSNPTKKKYVTKFGDDNCMPSCTCYSWRRTGYPCKHLLNSEMIIVCYLVPVTVGEELATLANVSF